MSILDFASIYFDRLFFLFFPITGGVGVANMIKRIENKEYMGFGNLCTYKVKE